MNAFRRGYQVFSRSVFVIGAAAFLGGLSTPVLADTSFVPQTKIRVTVVQWMPGAGEYKQWDALGGEYTVSQDGAISLPLIGTFPIADLDNAGLAAEIAKRLQAKVGLVQSPVVTVDVLDYPPIYVVGDVSKPGEYKFHIGLTILQSLAMSGGELRSSTGQETQEETKLVGTLQEMDHSILQGAIRIARLQAEMSDAKEISFEPSAGMDRALATAIYNQEKAIFLARATALDRQSKSLSELRDLLASEIDLLEEKMKGADENIKSAEDQLVSVKALIEKGALVSSRQIDMERMLTTFRSDRLDLVTAIMRARQSVSETTRNLQGLYDQRQAEVTTELQSAQADIDQLKLKRDVTQKLLLDTLANRKDSARPGEKASLAFTVIRRSGGEVSEFSAADTTELQPGDVVRVVQKTPEKLPDAVEASALSAGKQPDQPSQ
ncbi:polysaccharide biosynthesis/export family protein [Rhizobium binxianense]